jgi:hypothetical protein
MAVLKFIETHLDHEGYFMYSTEFLVDTGKLAALKQQLEHELRYVQHLIGAARRGSKDFGHTSRKFSFGDCEEWYLPLRPSDCSVQPDHTMEYTVG